MARAAPVTIIQLHAVVVVTAVKRRLEGMDADTFRFAGIPVRFSRSSRSCSSSSVHDSLH